MLLGSHIQETVKHKRFGCIHPLNANKQSTGSHSEGFEQSNQIDASF